MAENQYVNKVTYGTNEDGTENILIDLSKDTVDSAHLAEGYVAHDKTGAIINGTAKIGEGSVDITENGTYDVKQYAEANVNVPIGVDTSEDTVTEYDLYYGKTAHNASGNQITGSLIGYTRNFSNNQEGYSSTEIIMPCPFEPKCVAVTYLSGTITTYAIMDLVVWKDEGIFDIGNNALLNGYYCGHSTGAVTSGKYNVVRHQLELSKNANLFTYEEGKLHIKSPDSTYTFKNSTYRVIAFK